MDLKILYIYLIRKSNHLGQDIKHGDIQRKGIMKIIAQDCHWKYTYAD